MGGGLKASRQLALCPSQPAADARLWGEGTLSAVLVVGACWAECVPMTGHWAPGPH